MKKTIWVVAAILVLTASLTVCSLRNGFLTTRTRQLQEENELLLQQVESLEEQVDDLRDKLYQQEHGFLESVDYTVAEYIPGSNQVRVNLRLVPKEPTKEIRLCTPDGNTVSSLTQEGDAFVGALEVDLFQGMEQEIWATAGMQKEALPEFASLYCEYLPLLKVAGSESEEGSADGPTRFSASFAAEYPDGKPVAFTKFMAEESVNGFTGTRRDVTADVRRDEATGSDQLSVTLNVNKGEEAKVTVYAEDSLGYIHEVSVIFRNHADPEQGTEDIWGAETIIDPTGNQVVGYGS